MRADTWGRYREKWLANVDAYAAKLPSVRTTSPDEATSSKVNCARRVMRCVRPKKSVMCLRSA